MSFHQYILLFCFFLSFIVSWLLIPLDLIALNIIGDHGKEKCLAIITGLFPHTYKLIVIYK